MKAADLLNRMDELLAAIRCGRIKPDSRSAPRPTINLDATLYRAVTLTRQALRRQDTVPGELARAATLLLGLPDAGQVERLATHAEDQCAAARMALRLNGGG